MKATGIIRRIDDLGRIVIPKEVRRALKIHENDPFELFTQGDDTVCFRKYDPVQDKDWALAEKLVNAALCTDFVIFNMYGERKAGASSVSFKSLTDLRESSDFYVYEIKACGQVVAFLAISKDRDIAESVIAQKVLATFLAE